MPVLQRPAGRKGQGEVGLCGQQAGDQTVLQIRSQFPLGSYLSIKVPLKSAVSESCGTFLFPMAIYFFHIQMQMVLPLTECQSNGHTMDFLPKGDLSMVPGFKNSIQ